MNTICRRLALSFGIVVAGLLILSPGLAQKTAAGKPAEGKIEPFLGKPRFDMQQIYKGERFPNVVVAVDGTVLATWGNKSIRVRRSEDGGKTWGGEITIANPGFQGGGAIVDETSGDVLVFVEDRHPPAPLTIYRSRDHGKTWKAEKAVIHKDVKGHLPSMHMNEAGITLRHGKHAGRLLRPTRFYAGGNKKSEWPNHYTNAIYSDDGGKTWHTSDPFPENGTGEAAIAELSDGRLYYNSRVHYEKAEKPTRRREAWSNDGGKTWKDWRVVDILPDGRQDNSYGCMGGLVRLPVSGRDILIYSNIDTPRSTRERITVWGSFDGGKTWPIKRLVYDGPSAYSSLSAGRPGTPSEGWVYLQFEGGPGGGAQMARFNLSWLLAGERTGDGQVPKDLLTSEGSGGSDVKHVDPQPQRRTSAATVVSESVPLVHTAQILAAKDDLPAAAQRLETILKRAGSSLDRLVKLNFVLTDEQQRELLQKELARGTFGNGKPAVSFVQGKLPGGAALAFDAVATGPRRPAWKQVEQGEGFALLPPGTRIYVSGQAERGKDLAEATRKTLEKLRATLKFLDRSETSVVQLKAFLQPMAEHKAVQQEVARLFKEAKTKMPPLVLIEWQSSLPIEIELIAWGGPARPGEPLEYLTPLGMTASPVFSRVVRINNGKQIYLSGFVGQTENNPSAEIVEIYTQMGHVLKKAGSDYRHLVHATYYVTSAEVTKRMREIRPKYYDPKRPPASSMAQVAGTGHAGRTVTLDMIAVPWRKAK